MAIAIRDLQRNTSRVVDEVIRSGRPVVITRKGQPAVALMPIEEIEDLVLATPEVAGDLASVTAEIESGQTVSFRDLVE